jgi:hypothetical protein
MRFLKTLMSECIKNNETALKYLLQKKDLNLTFDQVIQHNRKLKLGQI